MISNSNSSSVTTSIFYNENTVIFVNKSSKEIVEPMLKKLHCQQVLTSKQKNNQNRQDFNIIDIKSTLQNHRYALKSLHWNFQVREWLLDFECIMYLSLSLFVMGLCP